MAVEKNTYRRDAVKVEIPEYQNGKLYWYGCDLSTIADQYGTPVHVGCSEAVIGALNSFRTPFEDAGLPLSIYYSVKTNPIPVFLDKLHKLGTGFEIISSYEGSLLKKLNVSPSGVIQTGVLNTNTTESFSPVDLKMVTVSSLFQLQKLDVQSLNTGKRIPVAITIRPGFWRSYWDITLNTSRKSSPVGVTMNTRQFNDMLTFIADQPSLQLVGLHMHLGSGIRNAAPYVKGIRALEQAALEAAKSGHHIIYLNIGGGFGLTSAPMMKIRNIVSSLLGLSNSQLKNTDSSEQLTPIATQLANTLENLERQQIHIREVIAEPGRILSGPCQLLILTVREVVNHKKTNYLICDAGAMSLSPMLLTEHHKLLSVVRRQGPQATYEVLGSLPSALDRVSASASFATMQPGDRIVVLDTGAYIYSMNNTFNGPRPPVVWIEDGIARLARRRETENDIWKLDALPGDFV